MNNLVPVFHPNMIITGDLNNNFKCIVFCSTTPFAAAESVALINHLSQIYSRYKKFNVNPAEFACMKAIVLFKSGKFYNDQVSRCWCYKCHCTLNIFSNIAIFTW